MEFASVMLVRISFSLSNRQSIRLIYNIPLFQSAEIRCTSETPHRNKKTTADTSCQIPNLHHRTKGNKRYHDGEHLTVCLAQKSNFKSF